MESSKYILLDAAKMEGYIYLAREMNEEHMCLYEGDSEALLGSSAPWLFELDEYSEFSDWLVERASGNSWGVVIVSQAETEVLYRHFRKFLIVQSDTGRELYFRFYDPRVLRDFLPTCDPEQLQEFFGPVDAFVMEDVEGSMLQFTLNGTDLVRKELKIGLEQYLLTTYELDSGNKDDTEAIVEKPKGKGDTWSF
jgi:hypothetical protein